MVPQFVAIYIYGPLSDKHPRYLSLLSFHDSLMKGELFCKSDVKQLGSRPSPLGSRPSLVGWRPFARQQVGGHRQVNLMKGSTAATQRSRPTRPLFRLTSVLQSNHASEDQKNGFLMTMDESLNCRDAFRSKSFVIYFEVWQCGESLTMLPHLMQSTSSDLPLPEKACL